MAPVDGQIVSAGVFAHVAGDGPHATRLTSLSSRDPYNILRVRSLWGLCHRGANCSSESVSPVPKVTREWGAELGFCAWLADRADRALTLR